MIEPDMIHSRRIIWRLPTAAIRMSAQFETRQERVCGKTVRQDLDIAGKGDEACVVPCRPFDI
jgi:hypothetical protein